MTMKLDKLLEWRCIGPFRGGRVLSVAGDPTNPAVAYFGACAGGLWKTDDAGQYWQCISDGYFKTGSVGAIAVANSDPNVIYAGMGEATIRIDVSHGDGVYKSADAGRSWQHMGLKETRHIGKIAVHPQNPDIAFVAALGHAHGTNPERGVYRTTDGGKTWDLVLHKSEKAGAVDVRIDVNNPRIVYATIWEAFRNNWEINSGGPDSGIWRSMDGGDTWEDLSGKNGLPKGLYGKTGISPSPAKPGRVWALLESKNKDGLYISDNYGDKWEHVNGARELIDRSWYYIHINADPQDPNTVYVDCFGMWKSIDGGKNFTQIAVPHGDCHDTWIDPNNNQHLVHADDGGACISFNGGASWSSMFNQPTAQAYHISTDNQWPYHVYLTQQDNSSLAIPSRSERGAIPWAAIYQTGTGESGYIEPHPADHNIVYIGAIGSSPGGGSALQLYNHRSKQTKLIANWPESHEGDGASADRYRFNWTYPIVISPHDPNTVYVGGNQVLKTSDMGHTWTEISPDLTRNDPDKQKPTGGPINRDSLGAET
ncbi:MAG: WD40/YVTN/BNR-like repeat-containing protein, partial [Candidatus Promineifilaceae bacterium]